MRTIKIIQILAVSFFLGACTKAKTRSKPVGAPVTEVPNSQPEPMVRGQNGTSMDIVVQDTKKPKTESEPYLAAQVPTSPQPVIESKVDPVQLNTTKLPEISSGTQTDGSEKKDAPERTNKIATPKSISQNVENAAMTATKSNPDGSKMKNSTQIAAKKSESAPTDQKENEVQIAADSEEIKKMEIVKIEFKNRDALLALQSQKDKVLFRGQLVSTQEAYKALVTGDEDLYCQVSGVEKFHKQDFVKISSGDTKLVDKENDIYHSFLQFENKNGTLRFDCTHSASGFYLEGVRLNFDKYITIYSFDGSTKNEPGYINDKTEDRMLRAVKLRNLQILEKITMVESAPENFALINGQLVGLENALNRVKSQNEKSACFISEVIGKLDSERPYVQVEKGIAEDTPREIPTAGLFYIYRADIENGFVLYCIQSKTAKVGELFKTMNGAFKFGALNRIEYKKKREELLKIHQEQKELQKASQSGQAK